jgi:hypothetical protein
MAKILMGTVLGVSALVAFVGVTAFGLGAGAIVLVAL